jgi:hypothetical protein
MCVLARGCGRNRRGPPTTKYRSKVDTPNRNYKRKIPLPQFQLRVFRSLHPHPPRAVLRGHLYLYATAVEHQRILGNVQGFFGKPLRVRDIP